MKTLIRSSRSLLLVTPLLLAGALAQTGPAASTLTVRQDAKLGPVLTGPDGRTLYLFTKDVPGVSNCIGPCAVNWPPLTATALPPRPAGLSGRLSLVARADGTQQVAYNGVPLYFWKGDTKPGDTTGQGVMNVWFAVNAGPTVQMGRAGALGSVLTGPNGLTLYTFAKDTTGVSNCTGPCAINWPPLLVSQLPSRGIAVRGALGTLTRADGSKQVTYQGYPLYFWKNDTKAGEASGEGVMNVWTVARP
ncbi:MULTISPECIES: hypothetical protein [Deinococcus]|jgi:predicted lipoprotein with Yx(FWY)xxD motif|uniref:Lipoprotein n=2 Tax=Deinococcus TaxID=1298 RepID=H8H3F1_DEIGI|nr:hypothetical protein [Deinococcus gobiensis]AFD28048.1 hypothetical protein DGo_PC0256 [Deinococcus gobiensis I-0]